MSTTSLRDEAQRLIAKYPEGRDRSALIPLLWAAQKRDGYVSAQAINEIAEMLGLSSADVRGVASFYHMLKLAPKGRHVVSVCHTLACALAGADSVVSRLEDELGIRAGQTASDGSVTLERAECLAACDMAPMIQVDYDEMRGPVSPEEAWEIVRRLGAGRSEEIPPSESDATARWDETVVPAEHTVVEPVGRVSAAAEHRDEGESEEETHVDEAPLVDSISLTEDEEDMLRPEHRRGQRLPPAPERLAEAEEPPTDTESVQEQIKPRGAE